jgi:hypothetical protein
MVVNIDPTSKSYTICYDVPMEALAEAPIFCGYLVGDQLSKQAEQLYAAAIGSGQPAPEQQRLLQFCYDHPWAVGYIDGALRFKAPQAEFRRRLYLMFAILESMPEYSEQFLPRRYTAWHILVVIFYGIRGVWRAIAGMIMLKAMGL